jgi:hypothetical protein
MKKKIFPKRDTGSALIVLSRKQQAELTAAIPFHRAAGDQEPMTPVTPAESDRGNSHAKLPIKSKWRQEHNVMEANAAFDTDILLNEPLYRKSLGDSPL